MTQEEFKSINEIEERIKSCNEHCYYDYEYYELRGAKQNTLAIIKMIDELGELWEVAFECGEKTGEFEYIQFKEHPLFNKIKQELTGVK